MKNSKAVTLTDIIVFLMNDLLGWLIIILFESTGYDNKFQDLKLHRLILVIAFIHIILSMICNVFFFKKERTKRHIQIGKKLFIYNVIMTMFPYLYLAFTWIIA